MKISQAVAVAKDLIEEGLDWAAFFIMGSKYPKPIKEWAMNRVVGWICREVKVDDGSPF